MPFFVTWDIKKEMLRVHLQVWCTDSEIYEPSQPHTPTHATVQPFLDVIVNSCRDYAGFNQLLHKL